MIDNHDHDHGYDNGMTMTETMTSTPQRLLITQNYPFFLTFPKYVKGSMQTTFYTKKNILYGRRGQHWLKKLPFFVRG